MPQRFSGKKHEPHAEAVSQRLQHLPQNVVPSCRVSFSLSHLTFSCCLFVLTIAPVIPRHSHSDFQAYTRVKKNKSYICKPDTGCQGKGIFITKSYKDIPQEHMICQLYISRVSRHSTSQSVLKTLHLINSFVISSAAFHY